MIPILDLHGSISGVSAAVTASAAPAEVIAFVSTRLAALDPTRTVRVKVFDGRTVYGGVNSQQCSIEVAVIPVAL